MLRFFFASLLFLFGFACLAQQSGGRQENRKSIRIKNSDRLTGDKNASYLAGNVVFEHEGAIMYCDSAIRYLEQNRIEAFNNVLINQGDTLFLRSQYLDYDGNTRLAKVTKNVSLKDPKMTLTTDLLFFNRTTQVCYYTTGGVIVDEENTLTSKIGYYHTQSKIFEFKKDVDLVNPRYKINSDTLRYNSNSKVAYFHGPTTIVSDSSYIYCENGLYRTTTDIAQLKKNAFIQDKNIELRGDSLYYEQKLSYGEAYQNITIIDTVEKYTIKGQLGKYQGGENEWAFVTGRPTYSILSDNDSLHIYGDTLWSVKGDTLDHKVLRIYPRVSLFKTDLQGKCDSLAYTSIDSSFKMHYNPVLWSDTTQLTADFIRLTQRNGKTDSIYMLDNAMIVQIENDKMYNQIKGRNMYGQFRDNKIYKVFVDGNGQTVYYAREDDGSYLGVNRADCSNIMIFFEDGKVERINFITDPDAKIIPLEKASNDDVMLKGFISRFDEKPLTKEDIFPREDEE